MITSEIKVNGNLIGHIYCVNMSEQNKKQETKYKVSFYNAEKRDINIFYVWHDRFDGYQKLMFKIWGKMK